MSDPFASAPADWSVSRVDRVASVNARIGWKALTASEYQPEGFVFLSTPNIKSKEIDFDNVNYISEHRYNESPELKLNQGDVLLAKDGNTLGITNLVKELPRPATVNGSIAVIRPSGVHSTFLRYVLTSDATQGRIAAVKDGMGVPHLFQWDIKRLPVPLPPLDEQRRIADFLDAETKRSDHLTSAKSTLQRLLLERRSASIHEAVTGQEHPEQTRSSLPWVESLPSHWKEVRLSLVADMGSGHTPSRSHPEWWVDCTIPWITTGEVVQIRDDRKESITGTREKISELGVANSSAELKRAGTVVLCRTAASAGFSAIMGTEMATSQDFVTWTCGPLLEPAYLLWVLRTMRPDLLKRLAMGSTHKTIYVPDLQSLRIPLPPVSEQRTIIEKVRKENNTLDGLVDRLNRQLSLLAERRQALITAAVTGQLDVTTAGRAAVG